MKNLFLLFALLFSGVVSSQVTGSETTVADTLAEADRDTIPFRYPYYGKRVPPFMGVVMGYEGIQNHCWEAGLIFHISDFYSADRALGPITGFALTYKQSFSNRLKTVEAEVGIYTPFSIGFGFNQNFYQGSRTFGFRPFLGTSWYHFQFLAGYNFYSKKQTSIGELDHFTLKVRYAIPVARMFRSTTPNPGNNY